VGIPVLCYLVSSVSNLDYNYVEKVEVKVSYYIVKDGEMIVGFYIGAEKPVGKVVIELDKATYLKELLAYSKGDKK